MEHEWRQKHCGELIEVRANVGHVASPKLINLVFAVGDPGARQHGNDQGAFD